MKSIGSKVLFFRHIFGLIARHFNGHIVRKKTDL